MEENLAGDFSSANEATGFWLRRDGELAKLNNNNNNNTETNIRGDKINAHLINFGPHEKHSSEQLQELTARQSASSTSSSLVAVNDLIFQYVNLNPVRNMIAQYPIEFLFICVIITYLIYYFSRISRITNTLFNMCALSQIALSLLSTCTLKRPTLVGNPRSKFVNFIKNNLNDTLKCRFSPLIYFWGTNPQTALFGYLQGQTSIDEMPRDKFRRQYLYVSDAQYLVSNVDLSQHYRSKWQHQQRQNLVQLQVNQDAIERQEREISGSMLGQNIRLVLSGLIQAKQQQQQQQAEDRDGKIVNHHAELLPESIKLHHSNDQPIVPSGLSTIDDTVTGHLKKEPDLSSSSGSSSDSGVFASGGHSTASSSTSSLADVTIDTEKCACKLRYDTCELEPMLYSFCTNTKVDSASDNSGSDEIINNPGDSSSSSSSTDAHQVKAPGSDATNLSERLEFGQCALDWHKDSHQQYHKNNLVALISAGMTTGSDKKYVTDTVSTLAALGYEVCVFIRRGVGGLKLSSVKFFSPAKWRDFEAAVLSVRQQRPGARLVAIGFSFGSIELCRYLTMSGKRSLIDAAFLISCPFDPEAGGRNMRKRALNRRIDAYLAKNLGKQLYQALFSQPDTSSAQVGDCTTAVADECHRQQQVAQHDTRARGQNDEKPHVAHNVTGQHKQQQQVTSVSNHNGSIVDLASLPKIKSLVDFEENYNRILQNYPDSDAYAADSRLQDHLRFIATPTLCLSSEDDFMAPLKLLPLEQIRANENLCMILTKRGGHMAFIDGLIWPKKPYFAQRNIGKYMEAVKLALQQQQLQQQQQQGDLGTVASQNLGSSEIFLSSARKPCHSRKNGNNDSNLPHTNSQHLLQIFDNGK